MRISIQSSALADLRRGYHFYERQKPGLGPYFLDTLASDIDSLQLYAGSHPVHFGRFHRLLSKRFPFAVYYQIEKDTIRIRAVLDIRRDPVWVASKMKRR